MKYSLRSLELEQENLELKLLFRATYRDIEAESLAKVVKLDE
jgi:hypothetical protein